MIIFSPVSAARRSSNSVPRCRFTLRVAHMLKREFVRRLPKMSSRITVAQASTIMSPTLMPMRNSIRRSSGLRIGHSALDFHGAARGVDNARKSDQGTVTAVLTIRPATSAARMAASLLSMRASITTDRKTFRFCPQAVIILHCNNRFNAYRPKGINRRRMKLSDGSTRSDKSALGKAMASDDKKIKTNPASKNEAPSKDKSDLGAGGVPAGVRARRCGGPRRPRGRARCRGAARLAPVGRRGSAPVVDREHPDGEARGRRDRRRCRSGPAVVRTVRTPGARDVVDPLIEPPRARPPSG